MFDVCTNIMSNISFKANLVINNNLYKKIHEGTPDGYIDNLIQEYRSFLDIPVIKEITEGDTIELYKAPHRPGYAIGIRFISKDLEKPLEGGVFTNKKIPNIHVGSFIFQTMQYIIEKSGIEQRYSERVPKAFIRAVKELYKSNKLQ